MCIKSKRKQKDMLEKAAKRSELRHEETYAIIEDHS